MSSDATQRLSYRAALASGELRALLISQLVSVGGLSVGAVALTVLVYRRTASPLLASLTFAVSFLPYVLGGSLLSGLVDRLPPRRLVVGCDAVSGVLIACTALPGLPLELIFLLLFASGTLSSVSSGARAALVRAGVSVDAYVPARSLLRIAAQLAQIGGNAGGGALVALLGPRDTLLVNASALACSALVVAVGVRAHPNLGEARGGLVRDSLRGGREVLAHPALRRLLLLGWLVPMFGVAPEAVAAPYVVGHGGSVALVGWWLVALPVGLIAGDFAGVRLLSPGRQRRLLAPAAAASSVPYLAFVFDPPVAPALALLVASGACGFYVLGLDARVRDAAPPRLFARTMTLSSGGLIGLQGLGFALAGAIAQVVGPATAIAIAGGCGILVTVALMGGELRPGPRREAIEAEAMEGEATSY